MKCDSLGDHEMLQKETVEVRRVHDHDDISTLQKHLGYFNCIFRLSELYQYDQEMLLGRFS